MTDTEKYIWWTIAIIAIGAIIYYAAIKPVTARNKCIAAGGQWINGACQGVAAVGVAYRR